MRIILSSLIAILALVCGMPRAEARPPKGAAQKRQNLAANADGLVRYKEAGPLASDIKKGKLVPVADTDFYVLDEDLGGHDPDRRSLYRHARPWTKAFLDRELSAAPRQEGFRFKITSLVRTVAYQRCLCRTGDGAPVCGKRWWQQSSHLTGATVDISKEGMDDGQKRWMRRRLTALQKQGKVIYVEESGCFHVMVRKAYAPPKKARR